MAAVSLRGLRKAYGAVAAIHGLDLEIADGEFVVLVGPSGSGKTTLLRMIAGLEKPSGGEIRVDGRRVDDLPPKARDMAMVFQHYALYPHMTVRENLGFSLRMRGEKASAIAGRVGEAAASLGLERLLERHPGQLSGGQQQRVAIGRAIVRQPRVFLFDEPLSNLDGGLRAQMRAELKALHRRLGTTTVYVTHDQTEAMAMAQRLVVLRAGHVEQIGTPLELYDRPANVFVAGFIGVPPMNLVHGRVRSSYVEAEGVRLPLARRLEENRTVIYGFRPEACRLGTPDGVAVRISVVEQLGPATHLHADLGAASVCAVTAERRDFRPGEVLALRPDPERVRLFDPETGQAI